MSFSQGRLRARAGSRSCLHPGNCPFVLPSLTIGPCFILQLTTTAVHLEDITMIPVSPLDLQP